MLEEMLVGYRFTMQQYGKSSPFIQSINLARAVAIAGERVHSIFDLSSYPTQNVFVQYFFLDREAAEGACVKHGKLLSYVHHLDRA